MMKRIALAASLTLALAACQGNLDRGSTRHLAPIPPAAMALMSSKGMSKEDPILIRAYKKESELEIWKRGSNGKYALLKTYPICRWSGQLGPKHQEGDRQVPEGFYTVTPAQLNPNSSYYLSFDTGYPNAYDRSFGRTGGNIMVHGACTSRGCFAMTDENIAEIYAIAREALSGGQRGFQFQSFPFRMTAQNLAEHRLDPNMDFWKNLKEGSDYFEVTREEPPVAVAGRRYVFNVDGAAAARVAQKQRQDEQQVAELAAKGVKPVKLVYDDGDSHESFRAALAGTISGDGSLVVDARMRERLGEISRPGSLSGPQRIALDASGTPQVSTPSTALAFASMQQAAPVPRPEPRAVAAQPAAPAPAALGSQETPFYRKMFSGVGDLFSTAPQPAAEPVQAVPAATSSVSPLPLQRGAAPKAAPQKRAQPPSRTKVVKAD